MRRTHSPTGFGGMEDSQHRPGAASPWRYLLLVAVPLLAALLLSRWPFPAATPPSTAGATAHGATATPLALFLLQLLVVLSVAKGAGWLLKRLGQPAVIGEMAAGLLLGPLL